MFISSVDVCIVAQLAIDTAQLFRVPVPTVVGVWRDGSVRLAVMLYQLLTRRETPTAEQLQQMMATRRTGETDEQFSSVAACMAVVATRPGLLSQ